MDLTQILRSATLDSCGTKKEKKKEASSSATLDSAEAYTMQDLKLKAANAIQAWCETDDLDSDETSADRLQTLFIGVVDMNKDGELSNEESDFLDALLNFSADYLAQNGIDDADISALLNDWDADAADRVMDVLNGTVDDGDESVNKFAFSDEQGAVFDGIFSGAFKKIAAIHNGVKTFIKKRISGVVHLSGKQKLAIKKMHLKSHSSGAMMKRMKSMRKRKAMGM